MANDIDAVIELLRSVGYELGGSPRDRTLVAQAQTLVRELHADPKAAAGQVLAAQLAAERAQQATQKAMESVEALESALESLLEGQPLLCRLEGVSRVEGEPRARVMVGAQLRELAVHPEADMEALGALMPWDFVCVHPVELVVIGHRNEPELRERAQGQVAEFMGYHDRGRGLVRVSCQGGEERVVRLAPPLRDIELRVPGRLVLQRDDDRWAIQVVPDESRQSRFEVSVDSITTTLDDLAGLESVIEPLVEDIVLRLLEPDLVRSLGTAPVRGMILESHKPGQGKTALVRAYAAFLRDLGRERGFDVNLYYVPPGALKIVWHGGDAKLVREDLCGAIHARRREPRTRPLIQVVVLDEIDSLGHRGEEMLSSAQNDAVNALLAEVDGMVQWESDPEQPPAEIVWIGMTNRIDLVDAAIKRPGRLHPIVSMPETTIDMAEAILAVYAKATGVWFVDDEVCTSLTADEVRCAILRPALAAVFDRPALRYWTESESGVGVTAGRLLANAAYESAMKAAARKAAVRVLKQVGVPAVTLDDLVDALAEAARSAAHQMSVDRRALARELRVGGHITRVERVDLDDIRMQRYLRAV
jgi:ATP-dependent 26S proteasome regulatory subunit